MKKKTDVKKIALGAVLTALVIILQLMGSFIKFGLFQVSLVLVPIVIGAALCGRSVGAWLGFVFGAVVLLNGDATAFLNINAFGTVLTVLLKGVACGLCAGVVYKLLEKKNKYLAVVAAAFTCPIVNTAVFILGCFAFFFEDISVWAGNTNTVEYIFLFLVGGNFLFELATNLVLSPVIVKLLNLRKK